MAITSIQQFEKGPIVLRHLVSAKPRILALLSHPIIKSIT